MASAKALTAEFAMVTTHPAKECNGGNKLSATTEVPAMSGWVSGEALAPLIFLGGRDE